MTFFKKGTKGPEIPSNSLRKWDWKSQRLLKVEFPEIRDILLKKISKVPERLGTPEILDILYKITLMFPETPAFLKLILETAEIFFTFLKKDPRKP